MKRRPRLERPAFLNYTFHHEWDRSRYTASYLSVERDEERVVQPMIVAALRARGCFAFIVDSGARKLRGRAFGAMRRAGLDPSFVMRGQSGAAQSGCSDILGLTAEGRFLAIEAKKPALIRDGKVISSAGQPTAEQLSFLDAVHRKHGLAGVAWGLPDVDLIWESDHE